MRSHTSVLCTAALTTLAKYVAADSLQWLTPSSSAVNITVGQDMQMTYGVTLGGMGELQGAAFSFYEIDDSPTGYTVARRSLTSVKRSETEKQALFKDNTKRSNKGKTQKNDTSTDTGLTKVSHNNTEVYARPIALGFNPMTRAQWFEQTTTVKGGMASFTAVSVGKLLVIVNGVEIWPCTESTKDNTINATAAEKVQMSKVNVTNGTECGATIEISRVFTINPSGDASSGAIALASSPPTKAASAAGKAHKKPRKGTEHHHPSRSELAEDQEASSAAFAARNDLGDVQQRNTLLVQRDSIPETHQKKNGSASLYLSQHPIDDSQERLVKRNGSASWFLAQQAKNASSDAQENLVKRNGSVSQYLASSSPEKVRMTRVVRRNVL